MVLMMATSSFDYGWTEGQEKEKKKKIEMKMEMKKEKEQDMELGKGGYIWVGWRGGVH